MGNDVLIKKVIVGVRITFDSPYKLCLILRGKINTIVAEQQQEMGPGGVIASNTIAYAVENSELLFVTHEKLKEIQPALAARIMDSIEEKKEAEPGILPAEQKGNAYSYSVNVQCPVCGGHFKAIKLFDSKLKQLNHDTEMRTRFEEIEPIHYKVWVCPYCLYANFRNYFSELTASQRSALNTSIEKRKDIFAGLLGSDQDTRAINNFRLAIECLSQIKAASNVIASAWLNLAWLFDNQGEVDSAIQARQKSLEAYEQFYYEERSLTPSMELQTLYIIGELNKRLRNIKKAHEYLLKVLHYKGHQAAMLVDFARDSLQELKQMAKETA
ncbi:MAG: DUF2225 domain-containing protein [Thermacetogeniaceae bacterium]